MGHIHLVRQTLTLLWHDDLPKTKTKTRVHMGVGK
jgi:hypothetical protein